MKEMMQRARLQFSGLAIESRMFMIIGLTGIVMSMIAVVVNLALDMGLIPIWISVFSALFAILLVYRVYTTEHYSFYSTIALLVLTLVVYPIFWITTGGSQGAIPFFFLFNFIIISIMVKRNRVIFMILLNLVALWGLYIYEYLNGDSIVLYQSDLSRLIDTGVFLTLIGLSVFFIVHWIMQEYNKKIGKLYETREKLSMLSLTDNLSGLYNRRYMMDVLKQEIRKEKLVSLIMIDIDHFKRINDTYGHGIGDEVITGIAQTIKNNLRGTDMVGRIGGEEFLVILRNDNLDIALRIAEKLRNIVEGIVWSKVEGNVTISSGVYLSTSQNTVSIMLERADVGLYQAKNNGRNQVVPYQENLEQMEEDVS
jgi:diguanylate cyclase (GGDEF)-like protein